MSRGLTSFLHIWKPSCPSTMWWRDCSFPVDWIWHPCQKSIGCRYMGLFLWTLNSIPLAYMSVDMSEPHCFSCCSFVVSFEIWKSQSSHSFLLFHDYFGYPWILAIPYEFEGWLFHLLRKEKGHWRFVIKIMLNL